MSVKGVHGKNFLKCVRSAGAFLLAVLMFAVVCALTWRVTAFMSKKSVEVSRTKGQTKPFTVVIDAGHGGMDSGTVGIDGSLEKNINLSVAKRLYELCRLSGIDCVMTRTEDAMLVDDTVTSHRKMHDLKNRLAIVNEIVESGSDAVLISIHMNNFSSPQYSGLQVWYSTADSRSAELASYVQSYARTWLTPGNNRETKRATSAIYILDRATMPAVLVECGFLSNAEECAELNTPEYQTKLAVTVFSAMCRWMSGAAE